jgi:Cytochrome oxidase maturation protein cbb3-type
MNDKQTLRSESRVPGVTVLLFIPVLLIACFFFSMKFYELVLVARHDPDGAFAVTPIVNYLLAGLGFLCLLGWAAYNGMFHDIEQPKHTMLETEARLDAEAESSDPANHEWEQT